MKSSGAKLHGWVEKSTTTEVQVKVDTMLSRLATNAATRSHRGSQKGTGFRWNKKKGRKWIKVPGESGFG